jgi:hypothetical protein
MEKPKDKVMCIVLWCPFHHVAENMSYYPSFDPEPTPHKLANPKLLLLILITHQHQYLAFCFRHSSLLGFG